MNIKMYKKDLMTIIITVLLGIIIIVSSKVIFNGGFVLDKLYGGIEYYEAEVTQIVKEKIEADKYIDNMRLGYQQVKVQIKDGSHKGEEYEIINNISRMYNTITKVGSKVIVAIHETDGDVDDIYISSFKRSSMLFSLGFIFLVVVLLVGGFKGLKSIISLVFTMICIIYLMLPLMLKGISPILAAIIIAIVSITVTLILVSGINKKTLSAILGTLVGVVVAGILAFTFGALTNLSGINMADAEGVIYVAESTGLKIKGLMFAAILVSALGAVMDVAMSISSSVFEIYSISNKISKLQLFKSGMNIGKDIIGTMTNTLILAFAGGSLNSLILLYSAAMPATRLLNLDLIGGEVIQGLAGTIGIVLTVPITVLISVYLCNKEQ